MRKKCICGSPACLPGFFRVMAVSAVVLISLSCETVLDNSAPEGGHGDAGTEEIALDRVATLLSALPLEKEHFKEVYSAVESSSGNGYDEEYTMADLFSSPGKGVGDSETKAAATRGAFSRPMRDLIKEYVRSSTKAGEGAGFGADPEAWLASLESSDVQIYWPYSENWDGEQSPVFTFDPGDGAEVNVGYRVVEDEYGDRRIEEVEVTEELAVKSPVWVVNRNSDCGFTSLDIMRRDHPEWDNGGGAIVVGGKRNAPTKTGGKNLKTLVLKNFTMLRHYDCWFAGGSEFFVKAGSVSDFYASTEAELRLYSPAVTDFMIVVKRKQLNQPLPFNAVLVSDWSEDLSQIAFMITEDDGGTLTQWKCSAIVKVASKSYGIDISLPFNSRDDIVWRGQLSRRYIEATDNIAGHFGGVDITFEVQEY